LHGIIHNLQFLQFTCNGHYKIKCFNADDDTGKLGGQGLSVG